MGATTSTPQDPPVGVRPQPKEDDDASSSYYATSSTSSRNLSPSPEDVRTSSKPGFFSRLFGSCGSCGSCCATKEPRGALAHNNDEVATIVSSSPRSPLPLPPPPHMKASGQSSTASSPELIYGGHGSGTRSSSHHRSSHTSRRGAMLRGSHHSGSSSSSYSYTYSGSSSPTVEVEESGLQHSGSSSSRHARSSSAAPMSYLFHPSERSAVSSRAATPLPHISSARTPDPSSPPLPILMLHPTKAATTPPRRLSVSEDIISIESSQGASTTHSAYLTPVRRPSRGGQPLSAEESGRSSKRHSMKASSTSSSGGAETPCLVGAYVLRLGECHEPFSPDEERHSRRSPSLHHDGRTSLRSAAGAEAHRQRRSSHREGSRHTSRRSSRHSRGRSTTHHPTDDADAQRGCGMIVARNHRLYAEADDSLVGGNRAPITFLFNHVSDTGRRMVRQRQDGSAYP